MTNNRLKSWGNTKNTGLNVNLGEMLHGIQVSLSLSPDQLAKVLGVSRVAIDKWTRGVGKPSMHQLDRIKSFFESSDALAKRSSNPFLSTGATRRALKSSKMDLFRISHQVRLLASPGYPILSRIKTGNVFGKPGILGELLHQNPTPAPTLSRPVATGANAGKNTYTYDAHTYHTKVPPQGILEFLEHYLPSGGLVLDPFAGSGMSGVAARMSGHDVILNELSPAACFIAYNYTETVEPDDFVAALKTVLASLVELRQWLYGTICRECKKPVEASYFVWSYRVKCYHCDSEFVLWEHSRKYGRTVREHKILSTFECPNCRQAVKKRNLTRTIAEPVFVGYKCCRGQIREHPLLELDIDKISEIEAQMPVDSNFVPDTDLPDGVNLNQPKRHGLTSVSKFYTTRNLSALSHIWKEIHRFEEPSVASAMAFVFTSLYQRVSRLSEYRFWGGSGNTARFNVPFIFNETNVFITFQRKAASILDHLETTASRYTSKKAVVCGSATDLNYLPDKSVDLVFTDPPFGANINYSEMNILWESWLGEFTDASSEAIVNRYQDKGVDEYRLLMTKSLAECHRVLRDNHWLILVFMNSSAKVWSALKTAIQDAGFVLERSDTFDKQHGTFKQFVSPNTAGCDLIIHCRKTDTVHPNVGSEQGVPLSDSIRRFFEDYLGKIPITVFIHVQRSDEVDYRLLYSEWISFALVRSHELSDFASFRKIAHGILLRRARGAH